MPGSSAATQFPTQIPDDTDQAADRTLVAEALSGNEQSFRILYRRHTPRVLRLVQRLMGGAGAESDDVMQEVWLRAMLGAPKLRWTSPFQTWLCGIAVRVYAESVRQHLPNREAELPDDIAAPELDLAHNIDIDQAIAALPEHYRVVFVLHDVEGRTHHDIADQLGIAVGTSKANLHRARRQMRVLLRTFDRETPE
jgi:RNA polymerase sigma-70 factor (ECF subfamily)